MVRYRKAPASATEVGKGSMMPWITAKYRAHCLGCDVIIEEGDRCFYEFDTKRMFCEDNDCGGEAARQSSGADAGIYTGILGTKHRNTANEPKCPDCFHPDIDHNLQGCKLCSCMRRP